MDDISEIKQNIREINGDNKKILSSLAVLQIQVQMLADHETRIRAVEKKIYWFTGIAAAAAASMDALLKKIGSIL